MWDFLPADPHGIYKYVRDHFDNAHGLTVINKYPTYCDFFVFSSSVNNPSINNFYLNNKEIIISCIDDFYFEMREILEKLKSHCFWLPFNEHPLKHAPVPVALSKRQSECAHLLLDGLTTKQIAQKIHLSHRTVEEYLMHLKEKLGAPNKTILTLKLNELSNKGLISVV